MMETVEKRFRELTTPGDYCTLRFVRERTEQLSVRQNVVQPATSNDGAGAMITVWAGDGLGYAGTCDLSAAGLRRAAEQALDWARRAAGRSVIAATQVPRPHPTGEYHSPVLQPWQSLSLAGKLDLLRQECERLKSDDRIADWQTSFWHNETETLFLTSAGDRAYQRIVWLVPGMNASANEHAQTQTRTFGGHGYGHQGGLEVLDDIGYFEAAPRISAQAIELLAAPDCPTGTMDVLLMPDQMVLQVHESVGHPLELDRILGDERNYAGTSFVTPDMFGTYRYGSDLLNITYDPTRPEQYASYAFDDDGQPAHREFIIKDGILLRPLGGSTSQVRSGLPGVANARASSWDRPPIDRMANLNLESGTSTLDEMIASIAHGVYMETNNSWSIDDSRNKFQFGCEFGRRIENGQLGAVVKNCNYRGISATFWRSLRMVGNRDTLDTFGIPFCGKGEPNQLARVGHAAPACVFAGVEVFGGA